MSSIVEWYEGLRAALQAAQSENEIQSVAYHAGVSQTFLYQMIREEEIPKYIYRLDRVSRACENCKKDVSTTREE